MKYNTLGMTGLTVSAIGYGCARLGGFFGYAPTTDMLRSLRAALDAGITFFDTADMYTQGESERLLGEAFRGARGRVVIATKVGYRIPAQRRTLSYVKPLLRPVVRRLGLKREQLPAGVRGSLAHDFSPSYIRSAAEQSLRRLRSDYIDLYQLHSPPTDILESGDFLDPLEELKARGKIRHYGVSCETVEDALICLRYPQVSSLQVRLNLLDQGVLEAALPRAAGNGVGIIARECFAGGLLATPADVRRGDHLTPDQATSHAGRRATTAYQRIADELHRPLPELALQFVVSLNHISVALLGMRTEVHLAENVRHLAASPLSVNEMNRVRAGAPDVSRLTVPG